MRDYFLSDAEVGKTTAGWSSFEVWKITLDAPRVSKDVKDNRPLWQILDEREDQLRIKRREIVYTLGILALLALGGGVTLLLR